MYNEKDDYFIYFLTKNRERGKLNTLRKEKKGKKKETTIFLLLYYLGITSCCTSRG